MPRLRLAAASSAAVVALLTLAGSAAAHDEDWIAPAKIPKDNPKRGMVYDGLKVASPDGACAGLLKVIGEPNACTHGPDPAPAGVDVRDRQSVSELEAKTPPSDPGDGDIPQATSIPCVGTGEDGDRVVAVYAHAANVTSRYTEIEPLIRTWAEEANGVFEDSAAQTGGSRQVRFLTDTGDPGCGLVVEDVQLSNAGDNNFNNTVNEIRAYNDPEFNGRSDRRYMVWMDQNALCGVGQIYGDSSKTQNNLNNGVNTVPGMVARIDNGCWGQLGNSISVEAHELTHNLGGVQLDAPHSSGGYHCTDESDTLCYSDSPNYPAMQQVCPLAEEKLLDCNDDDYFNTDPGPGNYLFDHWDVADSAFLTSTLLPGPLNNNLARAQGLAGRTASRTNDTNVNATKEAGEPNHAGDLGGKSVWYSWTAPFSKPVTIDTAGSSFDTTLGVYTGNAVNALTPVPGASNNDEDQANGILTSRVTFTPDAGQTYRIAVDGVSGASGVVSISLAQDPPDPPSNDNFAAAQPLTGTDATRINDYNDQATKEPGEPNHAQNAGGASIWYRWVAPTNGSVTIDTVGSSFDTTLGVYTGPSVDLLNEVVSNDNAAFDAGVLTSRVDFTPVAGTTYWLAVDGYQPGSPPADFGTVAIALHQATAAGSPPSTSTNPPLSTPPAPSTGAQATPHHILVCKKKRQGKKRKKKQKKKQKKCHIVAA